MSHRTRHHRGFTLVMAVTLVGMVAMTIGALGVSFANQARRTERINNEAQLRQLLLAGTEFTRLHLDSPTPLNQTIPLPDSLSGLSATLSVHENPNPAANTRSVQIDAALPRQKLSQTVGFSLRSGVWQLTAAELAK